MSKRKSSEIDDDYAGQSVEANISGELSQTHKQEIIADMIRMILARNSRSLRIRSEHFNFILQASNSKGNTRLWITAVKRELESIYGLSLHHFGQEVSLVTHLEPESSAILHRLWDSNITLENIGTTSSNATYLMPRYKRALTVINTPEEVIGGVTILIISMIVLSENKISESDLMTSLYDFGISSNLSIQTPVINKPIQSILIELTKRDYIKKMPSNGGNLSGTLVEYSLGERCKREFEPQAIYDFFLEVYKDEGIREKAQTSLKRCFPDASLSSGEEVPSNASMEDNSQNIPA